MNTVEKVKSALSKLHTSNDDLCKAKEELLTAERVLLEAEKEAIRVLASAGLKSKGVIYRGKRHTIDTDGKLVIIPFEDIVIECETHAETSTEQTNGAKPAGKAAPR